MGSRTQLALRTTEETPRHSAVRMPPTPRDLNPDDPVSNWLPSSQSTQNNGATAFPSLHQETGTGDLHNGWPHPASQPRASGAIRGTFTIPGHFTSGYENRADTSANWRDGPLPNVSVPAVDMLTQAAPPAHANAAMSVDLPSTPGARRNRPQPRITGTIRLGTSSARRSTPYPRPAAATEMMRPPLTSFHAPTPLHHAPPPRTSLPTFAELDRRSVPSRREIPHAPPTAATGIFAAPVGGERVLVPETPRREQPSRQQTSAPIAAPIFAPPAPDAHAEQPPNTYPMPPPGQAEAPYAFNFRAAFPPPPPAQHNEPAPFVFYDAEAGRDDHLGDAQLPDLEQQYDDPMGDVDDIQPIPELPEDTVDITATPDGGWRTIQGNKPNWQYENISPEMANAWKNRTFPRCLIMTAGEGATDPGEAKRRKLQEETVASHFGFLPRVVQARAETKSTKRNDFPLCNLLQAPSWDAIRRVLDAQCVSLRGGATIFFFPIAPPLPTLMGIFSQPESFVATGRQLTPTIKQRLSMASNRDRLIEAYKHEIRTTNALPTFTAQELADATIEHVWAEEIVRHWRGEDIPLVALYCDIPSTNTITWRNVRNAIRAAKLGTAISGHPLLYNEPLKCGVCHTIDHDTNMCYLPTLDDWFGPSHGTKNDEAVKDDERTDGRGKRGFKGAGRGPANRGRRGGKR